MGNVYASLLINKRRTWYQIPDVAKVETKKVLSDYVLIGKITDELFKELTGEDYVI